jgi:hypothetical protein
MTDGATQSGVSGHQICDKPEAQKPRSQKLLLLLFRRDHGQNYPASSGAACRGHVYLGHCWLLVGCGIGFALWSDGVRDLAA